MGKREKLWMIPDSWCASTEKGMTDRGSTLENQEQVFDLVKSGVYSRHLHEEAEL
jgi:hypothetical protein